GPPRPRGLRGGDGGDEGEGHRGPDLLPPARQPGARARRGHRLPLDRASGGGREAPPRRLGQRNRAQHRDAGAIDFASTERPEAGAKRLRDGSYIAIELNTQTAVPEWDGQKVYVMMEDPAYLTAEGFKFFVPRHERFYLVR